MHHRTYDNLGDEEPEDLVVLCRKCHATFHGKLAGADEEEWGEEEQQPPTVFDAESDIGNFSSKLYRGVVWAHYRGDEVVLIIDGKAEKDAEADRLIRGFSVSVIRELIEATDVERELPKRVRIARVEEV